MRKMDLLTKSELIKYLQKEALPNGHVFVNKGEEKELYCQLGVPQMLIRSVSQFARKSIEEVTFDDALTLYRAINRDLKPVSYSSLKNWRRNNRLSFFGDSQYSLLEYYLKNAK